MKRVKVQAILINNLNEETIINTEGKKNATKINYQENDIYVTIEKNKNMIILKREHPEYIINMIFEKGKTHFSDYHLTTINKTIKLEVLTTNLIVAEDNIKIKYNLSIDGDSQGVFNFNIYFWE